MEEYIDIEKIDIDDNSFNISRNILREDLYDSIKNFGMLEKPLLLQKNKSYILMSCHNRMRICYDLGIKKVNCRIVLSPDRELFFENLILKLFRNGAGPVGRIKALNIIDKYFSEDLTIRPVELRKITGLPMEYIEEQNKRDKILALPYYISEYIDEKDINFKTIRDLLIFESTLLDWLNGWLSAIPIRVNIFKKMTDHLFDIARDCRTSDLILPGDDSIKNDTDLYAEIFRVRYPDYSSMNVKASELINKISSPEISIGFPEFFEKDYISITFKINKNNRNGEWRQTVDGVKNSYIDELLYLL